MGIRFVHTQKILVLASLINVLPAYAAGEYYYSDILPHAETVTFFKDTIVIETTDNSQIPNLLDQQLYLIDRDSRSAQQIGSAKLEALTDRNDSKSTVRFGNLSTKLSVTSDGIPYQVPNASCEYQKGKPPTIIGFDSKELTIEVDSCSGISTMESTDEHLWVGTYSYDDYGTGGAEGLLIINRKTGKLVSVIDTGPLTIYGSARDPFSGDMWIFVTDRVIVVSKNRRHRTNMQFYHDFDASTGEPVMKLEAGWHSSNPIAVLAALFPKEHRSDFHREMLQHHPERLISEFSLYDFFMTRATRTRLSSEFSFMGPFVVAAAKHAMETNPLTGRPRQLQAAGWWRQLACRIDHPDADDLCAQEQRH